MSAQQLLLTAFACFLHDWCQKDVGCAVPMTPHPLLLVPAVTQAYALHMLTGNLTFTGPAPRMLK